MNNPTQIVGSIILFIVQWIFAPAILIGLFVIAFRLTINPSIDSKQAISKRLAFIMGLVLFLLAVVINSTSQIGLAFPQVTLQATLIAVGIGATFGFLLMGTIHVLARTRAISLFVVLLTGLSLIGLYLYVVNDQSRGPILAFFIGFLVGGLAYGVFFPDIFKEITR